MERETRDFTSRMANWQYAVMLLYLPVHLFGLPALLTRLFQQERLSLGMANFWVYAAGALFSVAVLWRFLRRELDPVFDRPFSLLSAWRATRPTTGRRWSCCIRNGAP